MNVSEEDKQRICEAVQITRQVSRHCEERVPLSLRKVGTNIEPGTVWFPEMVMMLVDRTLDEQVVVQGDRTFTTKNGFSIGIARGQDVNRMVLFQYAETVITPHKYPHHSTKVWSATDTSPPIERILKLMSVTDFIRLIHDKLVKTRGVHLDKSEAIARKIHRIKLMLDASAALSS